MRKLIKYFFLSWGISLLAQTTTGRYRHPQAGFSFDSLGGGSYEETKNSLKWYIPQTHAELTVTVTQQKARKRACFYLNQWEKKHDQVNLLSAQEVSFTKRDLKKVRASDGCRGLYETALDYDTDDGDVIVVEKKAFFIDNGQKKLYELSIRYAKKQEASIGEALLAIFDTFRIEKSNP